MKYYKIEKEYRNKVIVKCSCGKVYSILKRNLSKKNCGCPDTNLKGDLKSLFNRYKRSAISRGHTFNLTDSEFTKKINGKCYYCETVPTQKHNNLVYNGIDRLDNSQGYSSENTLSCCGSCNMMKGTLSTFHFTEICRKIVEIEDKRIELYRGNVSDISELKEYWKSVGSTSTDEWEV